MRTSSNPQKTQTIRFKKGREFSWELPAFCYRHSQAMVYDAFEIAVIRSFMKF